MSPRVSVSEDLGLANWPDMRPIFTTGNEAPYINTTAICKIVLTRFLILSAVASAKVSAQSPPCNKNAFPDAAAASLDLRVSTSPANTNGGKIASS